LTLNTNVTGRLFPEAKGLSEALAIVDDAYPAVPVPSTAVLALGAPPQILCTPPGSPCAETGNGGTPSPYQTQPNVFVGRQTNANTLSWTIPIDPPGVNSGHTIRLTNLRANAAMLGPYSGSPASITASVQVQGSQPLALVTPQPVVAITEPDAAANVVSSASIPQCQPHNAALVGGSGTPAFDFSIQASEGTHGAFEFRNYGTYLSGPVYPPLLSEQNVAGFYYATETGFYSPSLFTPVPTIGLADFGTRILVSFGSVSAGTRLFVPTTITMTGSYSSGVAGQLQLVQANANGNSAAGYVPVASTAMIGTTPVAAAVSSGSTAYAVYEVINADPNTIETATIPVAVAFTTPPAIGTVNVTTSLAPVSTVTTPSQTAPIPRFANFSAAQAAYTITACAGLKQ
jgi:hypothetical protein